MAQRLRPNAAAGCRPSAPSGALLALAVLLAALVASSLAASSNSQHQQLLLSRAPAQPWLWKRAAPAEPSGGGGGGSQLFDRSLEPIYQAPGVVVAQPRPSPPSPMSQPQPDSESDAEDEQFLARLKSAAEYLDEKLAARDLEQRVQRQQEEQLARDQERERTLLAKLRRLAESALEAAPSSGAGGGDELDSEQGGVVVVAPASRGQSSSSSSGESFGGYDESQMGAPLGPSYRVLSAAESFEQQQPLDNVERLYKNYLGLPNSPNTDQPRAPSPAANAKRQAPMDDDEFEGAGSEAPVAATSGSGKMTTTLLEDEEDEVPRASNNETLSPTTTTAALSAKGQPPAGEAKTSTSYGKLVLEEGARGRNSSSSASGMFSRVYAQLSRYLPFVNQISILRHSSDKSPTTTTTTTTRATEGDHADAGEHRHGQLAQVKVTSTRTREPEAAGTGAEELGAKPSVSAELGAQKSSSAQEDKKQQQSSEDKQQHLDVDAKVEEPVGQVVGASAARGKTKSGQAKRVSASSRDNEADDDDAQREPLDVDMSQLVPVQVAPLGQLHAPSHLMRQPLPVADAVLPDEESGQLVGRYIYAPTQHYYLNSAATGHHPEAQHHQQQAARHFHPGDAVYGSAQLYDGSGAPYKSAYAYAKAPSALDASLAQKTNDLYFLVMVGAFCVMAMAVVLAAGAFAYRVQQSRKSSQDTEYPTYGVVGPNNMSAGAGGGGKCGASPFTMGQYFTGVGAPNSNGSSRSSNKSGSAKHLADLYATAAAANGGSDSGLNSLGRNSQSASAQAARKAASSSASSLNNNDNNNSTQTGHQQQQQQQQRASPGSQDAARMYHYQHQKQAMIVSSASDRQAGGRHASASDLDSEDENDDGSYTVYECPGLASAHEMEIKNPLFNDDQTP